MFKNIRKIMGKKTTECILLLLFSVFLIFIGKLFVIKTPATVYAATTPANDYTEEWTLADGNFAFSKGASLSFVSPEQGFKMRFTLDMVNADFKDLKAFPDLGYSTWWGQRSDTYFFYEFTLYRGNEFDYSSVELHSFAVFLEPVDKNADFFKGCVLEKEHSVYSETVGFEGLP